MRVELHANATTTPRTRAYIQRSTASVADLAAELGVNEKTVRRWRRRTEVPIGRIAGMTWARVPHRSRRR